MLPPKYEIIMVQSNYLNLNFSIAPCKVGRAINIWETIQKRSHEPIYKTHTKIEAKRLRATTFAIVKLEERELNGEQ